MARKTTTSVLTADTLPTGVTAEAIRSFAQADRLANKYADKRKTLSEILKTAFADKTYVFETIVFKRSHAMVTDSSAIAERFPADKFPEYYVDKLDLSKVPDSVKAEFKSEQPRISVED